MDRNNHSGQKSKHSNCTNGRKTKENITVKPIPADLQTSCRIDRCKDHIPENSGKHAGQRETGHAKICL